MIFVDNFFIFILLTSNNKYKAILFHPQKQIVQNLRKELVSKGIVTTLPQVIFCFVMKL